MNLKASRLNCWALTEGEEWYFIVMSLGQLKEQVTRIRSAKKGVWISKRKEGKDLKEISNTSVILIMNKASYDSKSICLYFSIYKGRVKRYVKGCLQGELRFSKKVGRSNERKKGRKEFK